MIAASIAIFLAGMIALQPADTAKARSAAEDDKGPVFCFAMQRAPQEPGGKNGATSLRKAIKAPAGLGPDSLDRGRGSSPPMQAAMAIRTPLPSTNRAKLRVLDEQYRSGNCGYEARMKALHQQLYEGSELGAAAVLGCRERLPPALRSTILFRPPVSLIPLTNATSCWSGAPAELRSAALLFQARRLACSPPSGGVFYTPACCLAQSTTRAAPDAAA